MLLLKEDLISRGQNLEVENWDEPASHLPVTGFVVKSQFYCQSWDHPPKSLLVKLLMINKLTFSAHNRTLSYWSSPSSANIQQHFLQGVEHLEQKSDFQVSNSQKYLVAITIVKILQEQGLHCFPDVLLTHLRHLGVSVLHLSNMRKNYYTMVLKFLLIVELFCLQNHIHNSPLI